MSLTFNQLKSMSKTLAVPYEGTVINIRYAPSRYTPNLESTLSADEDHRAKFLPTLLAQLLTGWDILDDTTGQPGPITVEVLSDLGYPLLNALARAIIGDLTPGEETAPSSGSFSTGA